LVKEATTVQISTNKNIERGGKYIYTEGEGGGRGSVARRSTYKAYNSLILVRFQAGIVPLMAFSLRFLERKAISNDRRQARRGDIGEQRMTIVNE